MSRSRTQVAFLLAQLGALAAEQFGQRAAELDAEFEQTGKLSGALHGVPFSLKGEVVRAGGDDAVCSAPCALCVLMHDTHTQTATTSKARI